jgi:hypothetical protein
VLTVTSASLSSVAVVPSIPVGAFQQFLAIGRYTDGSTRVLSSPLGGLGVVTWGSSDPSVAAVDSNGLAIGVAAGITTITATFGSISGNTTLTVQ